MQVGLDALSRTIKAEEGTWSGSAITSRTRQQIWDLDSIGNWAGDQLDLNGDNDFADAGEFDVSNTFNAVNEQTARGGASLTYDAVGNLTDNGEDQEYVYDAFGRLVRVLNQSSLVISQHRYNGLGYRIGWQYDLDGDGGVEPTNSNDDPWLYFVYDSSWRVVASVFAVDDGGGAEAGEYLAMADDEPRELFVFHCAGLNGRGTSSKLDDTILRDRDANTTWGNAGDGTAEERTYYAQNWRGDVVALLDSTGGRRETIAYSAYGTPFGRPGADINGSGTVDASDFTALSGAYGKSYGDVGYSVLADINLSGMVNAADATIYYGQSGQSLGHGALSRDPSLTGGIGNRLGYAGYAWEASASKYHVRHRVLDPLRGRWSRRDPLGYVDSPTLFAYVNNRAMSAGDPSGLFSLQPIEPRAKQDHPGVKPVCPGLQEYSEEPNANGCMAGTGSGSSDGEPPNDWHKRPKGYKSRPGDNPCGSGPDSEKFALNAIVYHESRGQSAECQRAIAWSVINRTRNPGFWGWPNNIRDAVWQKGQFDGVENPNSNYQAACRFQLDPDMGFPKESDQQEFEQSRSATDDFQLNPDGPLTVDPDAVDPTEGADHFCSPATNDGKGCDWHVRNLLDSGECVEKTAAGCTAFRFFKCAK